MPLDAIAGSNLYQPVLIHHQSADRMTEAHPRVPNYELQAYLPPNVQGSRIPRYRVTFKELIKFENWQGIGWVRPLYFLVVLLLIVSTVVMEVNFVLQKTITSVTIGSLCMSVYMSIVLLIMSVMLRMPFPSVCLFMSTLSSLCSLSIRDTHSQSHCHGGCDINIDHTPSHSTATKAE